MTKLRVLHTSDWHLGKEFHGFSRDREHDHFLRWLEDILVAEEIDVLIVAGDIFDSQNPPVSAQRQLYLFNQRARQKLPNLETIIIGGHHDPIGRLEAPRPLLDAFGVHVVGALPHDADRKIAFDNLIIPLHDRDGKIAALCAAVPFLRLPDLPPKPDDATNAGSISSGVRQIYAEVLAQAALDLPKEVPLITTGHCHLTGCAVSELSERRLMTGGEEALPIDIFPENLAYVALGHLHKAQKVGGRETVRYSGSPLPLSVSEREYVHQVLVIELEGGQTSVRSVNVPRLVDVLRIPRSGAATREQVLAAIRAIDAPSTPERDLHPYLHVVVSMDGPEPNLRRDVEAALVGKGVRLASIEVVTNAPDKSESIPIAVDLDTLKPEDVFSRCWHRTYGTEPTQPHLEAFRELVMMVENGGETSL